MISSKYLFVFVVILSISFISAGLDTGLGGDSDLVVSMTRPVTTFDNVTGSVNSSDFWDGLDTPADIGTGDLTDDGTWVKVTGDDMTLAGDDFLIDIDDTAGTEEFFRIDYGGATVFEIGRNAIGSSFGLPQSKSWFPLLDNTYNLGSNGDNLNWASIFLGTSAVIDTMTIAPASITDSTGEISFGDENLTTTGDITGNITDTQVVYSDSGKLVGDDGLVYDGTDLTATGLGTFGGGIELGTEAGHPFIDGDQTLTFSRLFITPESGNNVMNFFLLPSGTEDEANFQVNNANSLTNRGRLVIEIDGVEVKMRSDKLGTGTIPTSFYIGESETSGAGLKNIRFGFGAEATFLDLDLDNAVADFQANDIKTTNDLYLLSDGGQLIMGEDGTADSHIQWAAGRVKYTSAGGHDFVSGTPADGYGLQVIKNSFDAAAATSNIGMFAGAREVTNNLVMGAWFGGQYETATDLTSSVYGLNSFVYITGTGDLTRTSLDGAVGGLYEVRHQSTGTISQGSSLETRGQMTAAGTITNYSGLHIYDFDKQAGTLTNLYGVKINDLTQGTNNWAIRTGLGKVQFGDNVLIDGDLNVTGNITGNQIYGEMWFHNDTTLWVEALTEDVWANVTAFDNETNGGVRNGFTYSSNSLRPQIAGLYKVDYAVSGSGGVNNKYHFSVAVNNVLQLNTESHRKIASGTDIGSASGTGFIQLAVGDIVTIQTMNEDSSADVNFASVNINLLRIGT